VNRALITPSLLRWARERRGLSYADIARALRIGPQTVEAWELGESYPAFSKAAELAKFLRIPFGYLFLSTPPHDDLPLPDFRTVGDRTQADFSPDFHDLCNLVLRKQEWYREYSEHISSPSLGFVPRSRIDTTVSDVVRELTEALSIDATLRRNCHDWSSYLTQLSQRAQSKGILVMRSGIVGSDTTRTLDVNEFRGFAISDPFAPVVFINSRDAIAAQIFTLLHEIAHIWIGQSGISNPDPSELNVPDVETFCNEVAAHALVPKSDFDLAWSTTTRGDAFLGTIARTFWVSTLVILRRAFELHKITREEFFRSVKQEKEKHLPRRKGSGGNAYINMLARNSQVLTTGVLSALRENQLVYRDAAALLGVRAATLPRLLKKYAS
jgi:Zn-dependent peptidase ImmA (M78 family)/transcriptional regulator with XRE-family HTH domain